MENTDQSGETIDGNRKPKLPIGYSWRGSNVVGPNGAPEWGPIRTREHRDVLAALVEEFDTRVTEE